MTWLSKIKNCFVELGKKIQNNDEEKKETLIKASIENPWFTETEVNRMFSNIAKYYCNETALESWLKKYSISKENNKQVIAIIVAGNIPLVGFHDIMCVLSCGYHCQVKLSSKDKVLYHYIKNSITGIDPEIANKIEFVDQIKNYNAVIATGSNLAANQFKSYFQKVPHIIRNHRNAVAILNGTESAEDICNLGQDIFNYYGLGCRNVSKIYVPRDYSFDFLLSTLDSNFADTIHHSKYKNNYDYNLALLIMKQIPFLQSNILLVTESQNMASSISILYYEKYDSVSELENELIDKKKEIQCIISNNIFNNLSTISFGKSQEVPLELYADDIDTMLFLSELNNGN